MPATARAAQRYRCAALAADRLSVGTPAQTRTGITDLGGLRSILIELQGRTGRIIALAGPGSKLDAGLIGCVVALLIPSLAVGDAAVGPGDREAESDAYATAHTLAWSRVTDRFRCVEAAGHHVLALIAVADLTCSGPT